MNRKGAKFDLFYFADLLVNVAKFRFKIFVVQVNFRLIFSPSLWLSSILSIYLSISPFPLNQSLSLLILLSECLLCLFHYLSLPLQTLYFSSSISFYLSISLSLFLSLALSFSLSLFIYLFIYLSIYLSISLYISLNLYNTRKWIYL